MTKVRLYHLASDWELPTSAVLEALHEAGHRLRSHFDEIDEESIPDLQAVIYQAGLFEEEEDEDELEPEGVVSPEEVAVEPTEVVEVGEPAAVTAVAEEVEPEAPAPAAEETAPAPDPQVQVEAPPEEAPVQVQAVQEPEPPPKPVTPKQAARAAGAARTEEQKKEGIPRGVAPGFRGFAPGFEPGARRPPPPARTRPGGPPAAFPPPDPAALTGDSRRRGARTAVSPTKRGRQTTRRAGGQAVQGRGRRLERRMQERERWMRSPGSKKRRRAAIASTVVRPDKVEIQLPISLKDLSAALALRIPEIMKFLMGQGIMINQNQPVSRDAIEHIGMNWKIDIVLKDEVRAEDSIAEIDTEQDDDESLVHRQPIVAVLGHVDHGKTSLLDHIRKTKKPVTALEAGGITQHIGAYVAEHNGQKLTFIDTPGHEAFTEMRARGANVTDIVLLIVAADDGVMPQTKEAIQHAQAAKAHIIVAANKIDKRDANLDKVLQDLSQIDGMLPVQYGGDTEVVPCSAITGQGVDDLLETILTYAELLDLKANPDKAARGTVLEAKRTMGRGIVVTCLIEDGTLHRRDLILSGQTSGRVRMMFDDNLKPAKAAGPGAPVEVLGFDEIPEAGDRFYVLEKDAEVKQILAERQANARTGAGAFDHIPTDEQGIWKQLAEKEIKEVPVILKADVQGSLQVLKRELQSLSTDEVRCKVIRDGVGGITTADVLLATASEGAVVVGFGVVAETKARALAKEKNVAIHTFRVIYELIDGVKQVMAGVLEPEEREAVLGQVEIRKIFKTSKFGNLAGCFVEDGVVRRNALLRLARDGIILWQGEISSLRRFSEDVTEVRENFECGIKLKGYEDIHEGDRLEVFEIQKIARTLD